MSPTCAEAGAGPTGTSTSCSSRSRRAQRAECLGRHVGAVIVREGRIVATGYNGTPRGFLRCNAEEQGCHRCAHRERYPRGEAYDVCICVHAEQNAVLQAARLGYSLDGGHCYTTLRPCFGCLKELRQAGVERIVYLNPWAPPDEVERRRLRRPAPASRGARGDDRAPPSRPGSARARLRRATRGDGRWAVRRPPPIAALFTLLAAGLAVIAVARVGGWGARRGGGCRRARSVDGRARRAPAGAPAKALRRRIEDSVDSSLTRGIVRPLVFKGALAQGTEGLF